MIPLKITYTDFQPSEAISALIDKKVKKLEDHEEKITSVEVFVSAPHRHETKRIYHIRIHLVMPGFDIEVNREPEMNYAHHDIKVALRDAFDSLYEQVGKKVERRREQYKPRSTLPHGRVKRIFPHEGFGFVVSSDGRELYFNERSVLKQDFSKLKINTEVRFSEEMGENGPQVSSMSIVGRE